MNCPKCNTLNPSNAVFCGNCGTRLNFAPINQTPSGLYVSIGRTQDNNIVINPSDVSGNHCRLYSEGGNIFIEDLNSTNGTYVNGKRITKSILRINDNILVGQNVIDLRHPSIQNLFNSLSTNSGYQKTSINAPLGNLFKTEVSGFKPIFLSPIGAVITFICFFLPWFEFSCGGTTKSLSGSDVGGIMWVVLLSSVVILVSFFVLRSQRKDKTAMLIILITSSIALAIMMYRFVSFYAGEDTEFGKIKPSDIGFTLKYGFFGTMLGLITSFIGSFLIKEEKDQFR